MIRNYRDLEVWKVAMNLADEVLTVTRAFPGEQRYILVSQMQRCAISVPSNIAEGHARKSTKEYMYHLSVAIGSLSELETQLELSFRQRYLKQEQLRSLFEKSLQVKKMVSSIRSKLKEKELS